ncbi:HupE/UreJ family protein [Massilia sp. S19_KUP03_FR1]|uniref:HupE/UreJ family protein n=1 Tax=Massilia sp. S19_KUP03_FR1 TaxID=3025503 RepID=UPI002FCD67A4
MFACLLCLWCSAAGAHPTPQSLVWIDTTPTGLQITAQLPLSRLGFVFGQDALGQQTILAQGGDALSGYLLQHIGVRSGGASWQVLRPRLALTGSGPAAGLEAVFEVRAPPGVLLLRRPELVYDIITHEVRTHRVLVFLRNDWQGGFSGQAPLLLGELRYGRTTLPLVLDAPGSSVTRLFVSGIAHSATGVDHLVFLLMLVLAAPLTASGRRWRALRPLAVVITAFTLGHTITLVAGSAGSIAVPAGAMDVAVALTIALAAWHAWRPLFARAEAWMALGFGAVHGLAFSASLAGAGLTPWQHAQALLAFNLGIEAMQLLALALVLPPLLLLARARPVALARLRCVLAGAASVLAILSIAHRLEIALPAGVDSETGSLLVMALLWLVFLGGLGAARWRARARDSAPT